MKATWTQEEVCSLTGLEPHILRFWEGEFPQLRPRRNSAGQRVYRERDVEVVGRLKGWIYDEGLAIPAARRRLKEEFEALPPVPDPEQLGMPFLEAAKAPEAEVPPPAPSEAAVPVPPAVPVLPDLPPELSVEDSAAAAMALFPTPEDRAALEAASGSDAAPPAPAFDPQPLREGLLEVLKLLEGRR